MVSYYNPLAMYRQHSQSSTPGGVPSQFHHQPSPPVWYGPPGGYQPAHQGQQYLPEGLEHQQPPWHHHPMFQEAWTQPEFQHPSVEDPQLPSPPITVSSSELSSPGGAAGTNTPPQHTRPLAVRSPYEWMKKPSYQSQPNPGKTRTKDKYRVVYSDHQRLELEKEFHYSRYITIRRKAELASNLGLSERQVKIWFQNRRAKERKQVKKREELIHKEKMDAVQHFQHLHGAAVGGAGTPLPSTGL